MLRTKSLKAENSAIELFELSTEGFDANDER